MTSEIRANTLKNRVGLGTVSFTNTGVVVSGIVTANSFSGPYNGTDIVGTGLTLTSTDAGSSAAPIINLFRNSASPADADYLGQIKFQGESDTGVQRNYAKITGKILDASNGTEDGILEFAHIKGGSQTITGRWRSDSLQLLNSTNLTVDGDIDVDGHTNLDNVSVAGVSTFSGVVRVPNGSAGAPAIHFGDSDSGVYGDASNGVRLTAGGSDTIVATTNGVTFPPQATALTSFTLGSQSAHTKPLYFADAAGVQSASILLDNSSQELRIKNGRFSGILSFYTYNTEKVRIESGGGLKFTGQGTSIPVGGILHHTNNNLYVRGGTNGLILGNQNNTTTVQIYNGYIKFETNDGTEKLRIDSSGRVLIGSTSNNTSNKVGDSALQVYTQDQKHPAIRIASGNSNGFTMLSDAYMADESQVNIGVSYSSAKLVLSTSVKPSDTTADVYLSSQDTFSARPTALTMNHQGILAFLNTDTNATTTTDSAVSLTERFRIRADGTIRIGGDLYTDTAIMMTLKNRAGTGSQIQFHGTGTGNGNSDGLRVGYNGTGGQMWLFENGGYLRFATSNNERVRIDEYGAITHTRGDNTTRWDVEFRQTGGISDGNYGGIKWTQNSTGGVHLAGMKLAYANTGRPDLVFSQRNRGGGTGEQEIFRLESNGEIIKTRASTRYENSQVRTIEFPLYLSSGTTHTILTLGGSFDTGFVCFAVLEYIGLYAYAGNSMSGGVRRAYTRRTYNNTQWRDFDDQVSENYGENYRPTLYWENGVLKCTVGGSVQITGFIKICGHGNNINNVQFTRNQGV